MDSITYSLKEKSEKKNLITCNSVNYKNSNDVSGTPSIEDYDYSLPLCEVMKCG
jgi:hypothetical protein